MCSISIVIINCCTPKNYNDIPNPTICIYPHKTNQYLTMSLIVEDHHLVKKILPLYYFI
jgi:hypothetical protein